MHLDQGGLPSFQAALTTHLPLLASPNNVTRSAAEAALTDALNANPANLLYVLVQWALDTTQPVDIRQTALLYVKRTIPLYWSPAFDSFKGPACFPEEVKSIVRDSLLSMVGDPQSKIRSAATYAIVQISAVDFPDQWPQLLPTLSENTLSHNTTLVVGSLSVLHEIFDDVISEDLFFTGGVGVAVLQTCESLLSTNSPPAVKIAALKLIRSAVTLLTNSSFDSAPAVVDSLVEKVIALLGGLLVEANSNESFASSIAVWGIVELSCETLDLLANSFFKLFAQPQLIQLTVQLLWKQEPSYNRHSLEQVSLSDIFSDMDLVEDPESILTNSISRQVEFLQSLVEINHETVPTITSETIELLIKLNCLPTEKHQDYVEDFNNFVTDETDLSIDSNVRTTFMDFFRQLNIRDTTAVASFLLDRLMVAHQEYHPRVESMLFILQTILDSDDGLLNDVSFDPLAVLELFLGCIRDRVGNLNHESQILISRLILICPKLIFTYKEKLEVYGLQTLNTIVNSIDKIPLSDEFNVICASILVSLQYFNHFMRAKSFDVNIQAGMIYLFNNLVDMANEDTLIMLLESMTIIISIDNKHLSSNRALFKRILQVGFENSSNFTLTSSVLECVSDYFNGISSDAFMDLISDNANILFDPLNDSSNDYKPEIDFSLQLLDTIVTNNDIPQNLFHHIFTATTSLILVWDDDQILQGGTQLLISLCDRSMPFVSAIENGPETLLKIVSKLLDPGMSDRAIFRLGDLITLILDNFADKFHNYLTDIMNGLTVRLSNAREVPTIENLILIFNKLTIAQPRETIEFLFGCQIDGQAAIVKIFPIWFNAFEVMRGYESIYSNVCAFVKIFQLRDSRLSNLVVDGDEIPMDIPKDLIVTRSMAKKIRVQHYQIPSDCKIVKLLINELKNEVSSMNSAKHHSEHNHSQGPEHDHEHEHEHDHEHDHDHSHNHDDNDDDGWEDFDDELYSKGVDFTQLKQFMRPDGELKREAGDNSIFEVLVGFFKFEAAQATSQFETIFNEGLNDAERKIVLEYVAFS